MAKTRNLNSREAFECLLGRAQNGQLKAREEIFLFLYRRFLWLAKRRLEPEDAEEITQETMLVLNRHFGEFENVEELMTFTNRVMRNKIGNLFRKRSRRSRYDARMDDVPELIYNFEGDMDAMEVSQLVMSALDKLGQRSPECRMIILALSEGLTVAEVGLRFQLSGRRIDDRIYRCRQTLREILWEDYGLRV